MKMPAAFGSRKQAILLAVLAVVLILAVVRWRPGGGAPKAAAGPTAVRNRGGSDAGEDSGPARPAKGSGGKRELSPDEVPILEAKDFAAHSGTAGGDTGRDLFTFDTREPTRRPPPTPYPPPPPPGDTRFVGPLPPPAPTPTPKPPEITFTFVGTFGPKGHPIAVIKQGDQVFNVRAGDILFDKFVLRSVGYESLDIGFVGFPDGESRRIGITPN